MLLFQSCQDRPNISGSFSLPGTEAPSKASHTGVFTVPGNTTGDYASGHVSGGGNPIVYLDSTLASNVYKEINEIRPNTSYCLIIIKQQPEEGWIVSV